MVGRVPVCLLPPNLSEGAGVAGVGGVGVSVPRMQGASSEGETKASGTLEHPASRHRRPRVLRVRTHSATRCCPGRPEHTVMGCQGEVSTGTRSSCSDSSAKSLFGIVRQRCQLTVAFQKALWVFGLNSRPRSGPCGAGHCLVGPSEDPTLSVPHLTRPRPGVPAPQGQNSPGTRFFVHPLFLKHQSQWQVFP